MRHCVASPGYTRKSYAFNHNRVEFDMCPVDVHGSGEDGVGGFAYGDFDVFGNYFIRIANSPKTGEPAQCIQVRGELLGTFNIEKNVFPEDDFSDTNCTRGAMRCHGIPNALAAIRIHENADVSAFRIHGNLLVGQKVPSRRRTRWQPSILLH